MKQETENKINEIFEREKKNLIEEVHTAGEPVVQLFDVFAKILTAQEKEYEQLFSTSGFLPKQYEKPVANLFINILDTYLFQDRKIRQLEDLLEHARHLTAAFMNQPPVFVQQKLTVDGKLFTNYIIENFSYEWSPNKAFFPGTTLHFPSSKPTPESNAQLTVRRIPLTHDLLISILNKFLDDSLWEIEETDPVEHFQERIFQWDKAFGPMFENAQ